MVALVVVVQVAGAQVLGGGLLPRFAPLSLPLSVSCDARALWSCDQVGMHATLRSGTYGNEWYGNRG